MFVGKSIITRRLDGLRTESSLWTAIKVVSERRIFGASISDILYDEQLNTPSQCFQGSTIKVLTSVVICGGNCGKFSSSLFAFEAALDRLNSAVAVISVR